MVARSELRSNDWMVEAAALLGLMVLAAIVHIIGLILFIAVPTLFTFATPPEAPVDVYEVALVSLPQSPTDRVQMDVRVESAPTPVDVDAPQPVDDAGAADQGTAEPDVAPNPSDLAFQTPDAVEAKGDPTPDNSAARAEAMRALDRQNLLAAIGTAESSAGDPDSMFEDRIDLGGLGMADPELARYENRVRQIVMAEFKPLPTLAQSNPGLKARINLRINLETGVVQSWNWVKKSGNASWDGAAERAVDVVRKLPIPPAKHRERYVTGYDFIFDASSM
ncbi:MAG: TonB C-terminal domain-containing protein [Myxococcota bacterium]